MENLTYCTKMDTRRPGMFPTILGTMPSAGYRADLNVIRLMIRDGASDLALADHSFQLWCQYRKAFTEYRRLITPPRNTAPDVKVYTGMTGKGKTRQALYQAQQGEPFSFEKICILLLPTKGTKVFFDGYVNQDCLILDEFHGSQMPIALLLRLLDRYALLVDTKHGITQMTATKIWITSNIPIEDWYSLDTCTPQQFQALKRRIGVDNINHFYADTPAWVPPEVP